MFDSEGLMANNIKIAVLLDNGKKKFTIGYKKMPTILGDIDTLIRFVLNNSNSNKRKKLPPKT